MNWSTRDATLPRRSRRLRIAALLVLAFAVLAAGCGSDDNSSGTAATAPSAGKPATGTPLKIAVMLNATGPSLNGSQLTPDVMRAWATSVNDDGGVANHPVELEFNDLKADPSRATAAAAKVAADTSISAVVMLDPYTEGVYAKTLTKAGIPVIGGLGVSPVVWGAEPNWLPITTTFPSIINAPFIAAQKLGAKKTATIVCAEYPTCAAIGPIAQNATEKLGMEYGGTVKVSLSAPDYTAQCLQLKQRDIDFVLLTLDATNSLRVASACKTQAYDGNWALTGALEPAVMVKNDPGVSIASVAAAFPWWVNDAPVAAYRKLMSDQGVSEDAWANPNSTAAYATLELLKKTLDANKASLPATLTRAAVIKAYGTIKDETLDGLLPQPVTFTPGKPGAPVTCFWVSTFEDGTFSGTELTKPTCDPPELAQG